MTYRNPVSSHRYRLSLLQSGGWRITKSIPVGQTINLFHLWGRGSDATSHGSPGKRLAVGDGEGASVDGDPCRRTMVMGNHDVGSMGSHDALDGLPSSRDGDPMPAIIVPYGSTGAPGAAIDLLIRGKIGSRVEVDEDPRWVFATVCLSDADRTFDLICQQIRSAVIRLENGVPGFRPYSPMLKAEKEKWLKVALDVPTEFASWWRENGFQAAKEPTWLTEALAIVDKTKCAVKRAKEASW